MKELKTCRGLGKKLAALFGLPELTTFMQVDFYGDGRIDVKYDYHQTIEENAGGVITTQHGEFSITYHQGSLYGMLVHPPITTSKKELK